MNSAVPASETVAKRPRLVWAILVLYTLSLLLCAGDNLPDLLKGLHYLRGTLRFTLRILGPP